MTEFLEPVMRLACGKLAAAMPSLWPLMLPPRLPMLPDLPALLNSLLANVRQSDDASELDPIPESCEDVASPKRFTAEVCKSVENLIDNLENEFFLSYALSKTAETFGGDSAELAYASVLVPRWFEHEHGDAIVAHSAGRELRTVGYFGDDLRVLKEEIP